MTDVSLLIDQGNTRLKWVWSRGPEIDEKSAGRGDFKAFGQCIQSGGCRRPESVMISSVAGAEDTDRLGRLIESRWAIRPRKLESNSEQGGVRNGYTEPATLGVDRWLAIVGAVGRYGKPIIIWDLGTASTLDAVDASGQHLGGLIYPGPATMLDSLRRNTKLSVPDAPEYAAVFAEQEYPPGVSPGRATAACIGHGVLAAQLGALNQFQKNVSARIGENPKLVVTGGAAETVMSLLNLDHVLDPWLVFRGMLIA
jgi:type III pantothenate kinase